MTRQPTASALARPRLRLGSLRLAAGVAAEAVLEGKAVFWGRAVQAHWAAGAAPKPQRCHPGNERMRLEALQPHAIGRGLLPEAPVTVVSGPWHRADGLPLRYRTPAGQVADQLLSRADEAGGKLLSSGRPWGLDGDGARFRLVAETHRSRPAGKRELVSATLAELGEWGRENGEWRMANGEWRMANGEWRMGNGEWGMANGPQTYSGEICP